MNITTDLLAKISTKGKFTKKQAENASSVVDALDRFGASAGLLLPHRLAHYLAQIMHEAGEFVHDREIWGPTDAQKRYDTRTDLGNTPEIDGDGELYKGRTAIQVTGRSNYQQFTAWARKLDRSAPDFVANPELVNTSPWEGLAPIWYWDTRKLNKFADANDIEMVTRRINGGTNGHDDRVRLYTRAGLVLAGFDADDVAGFQREAREAGWLPKDPDQIDGVPGPKTRAAIHRWLAHQASDQIVADPETRVTSAPVVEREEVPVVPAGVDKPGIDIGAVVTAATAGGASQYVEPVLGTFGGLTPMIQALLISIAVAALVYLVWGRAWMAARARAVVADIKERRDAGLPG